MPRLESVGTLRIVHQNKLVNQNKAPFGAKFVILYSSSFALISM